METFDNENKIRESNDQKMFENVNETDTNECFDNKEDIKTVDNSEIRNNFSFENVKGFEDMWTIFVEFEVL